MKFEESETIELKKSTSQLDNSLEDLCAFSNHKGGTLYFGINDNSKIIGQVVSDSTLRNISQKILQKIKPEIQPEIREIIVESKTIIKVVIKEGQNKPYSLDGVSYKRIGSETKAMTFEELRRLAFEQVASEWELQMCKAATIKDINIKTVNEFLKLVRESKRLNIVDKDKIRILTKLGLIKDNKITNACIVLFGREPIRFDPNFSLRARRLKGETEIISMKDFNGNLFENLESGINFIKEHIRLEAKIEGLYRKERWEIPIEVLREIIINAFIHRDYTTNGFVYIDIRDKELIISNTGYLPGDLKISNLYKIHDSVPRNRSIAETVYYTGLIDKWGQGILNVIALLKKEKLEKPIFEQSGSYFRVYIKRPNVERLVEPVDKTVDKTVDKIIPAIKENPKIRAKDLIVLTGLTRRGIEYKLNQLKKQGILERIGSKKGGYWSIKKDKV